MSRASHPARGCLGERRKGQPNSHSCARSRGARVLKRGKRTRGAAKVGARVQGVATEARRRPSPHQQRELPNRGGREKGSASVQCFLSKNREHETNSRQHNRQPSGAAVQSPGESYAGAPGGRANPTRKLRPRARAPPSRREATKCPKGALPHKNPAGRPTKCPKGELPHKNPAGGPQNVRQAPFVSVQSVQFQFGCRVQLPRFRVGNTKGLESFATTKRS